MRSLPKPPVRVSGKYRLIKCDGHNLHSSCNDQVVKATDSIITGSVLYDDGDFNQTRDGHSNLIRELHQFEEAALFRLVFQYCDQRRRVNDRF